MQQSKIEIIDNDAPEAAQPQQPSKLNKLFSAIASRLHVSRPDPEPTINGCNYFTGELSPEFRDRFSSGQFGISSSERDNWKMMWRTIGVEAPGELPKGAMVSLFIDGRNPDCHAESTVRSVTRTNGKQLEEWDINYTPMAEGEERRISFAVIILPKAEHPEAHYNYNEPKRPAAPKQSPQAPGQ